MTALHIASMNGQLECVRILLAAGGDPAVADDDGNTAADLVDDDMQVRPLHQNLPKHKSFACHHGKEILGLLQNPPPAESLLTSAVSVAVAAPLSNTSLAENLQALHSWLSTHFAEQYYDRFFRMSIMSGMYPRLMHCLLSCSQFRVSTWGKMCRGYGPTSARRLGCY